MIDEIKKRLEALPKGELRYNVDKEIPDDRRVCLIEEGDPKEHCICCVALAGNYDEVKDKWEDSTIQHWDAFGNFFAHAPEDIRYLLCRVKELENEIEEMHLDAAGESR